MVVWECNVCGVPYGLSVAFADAKRASGGHYFCPNGHRLSWNETEADRLRRELQKLQQAEARHEDEKRELRQERAGAEARAAKAERARRRIETRVKNGACPDCNRTFANLARHMSTKHGKPCNGLH